MFRNWRTYLKCVPKDIGKQRESFLGKIEDWLYLLEDLQLNYADENNIKLIQ